MKSYDVVIVGAAMTGTAFACILWHKMALQGVAGKIAILDADRGESHIRPKFDGRTVALNAGSCERLKSYDLWQASAPQAAPIRTIHVSDQGYGGGVLLDASNHGVDAFGQVLPLHCLGNQLFTNLSQTGCDRLIPEKLLHIERHDDHLSLTLAGGEVIGTRLLILAHGGDDRLCQQLDLHINRVDYDQHGITAVIQASHPIADRAFERFTPHGPLALLPLGGARYGVVWSVSSQQLTHLNALDDGRFCAELQRLFGFRLGRLELLERQQSYPLQLKYANYPIAHRALLLGNAAHTLHPVAGQGFNLTLRDIDVLTDEVSMSLQQGGDPGSYRVLSRYWQRRKLDVNQMVGVTNTLVTLFSNNDWPMVVGRTLGLTMMQYLPPLQQRLVRHAMGWVNL